MNPLLRIIVILSVILLSACYETDSPVFEKGEKNAISGKYQCTNRISGEKKTHTFTEKRDGIWPFANYQYIDNDGDINLFRKTPSGLLIVQSASKKGKFTYAFLDAIDEKTFLLLSADLMNKGDYIDPLLKKFGIETKKSGDASLLLRGDKGKISDFLAAHDKALLTVVLKCERWVN